jgi:ATP-dependent DNA helicase PIF1
MVSATGSERTLWDVWVDGIDQLSTGGGNGTLPIEGLPAAIGVDFPLTHRVGDYFGQPRDPEQVIAAKIDELDAIEKAEDLAATIVPVDLWPDPCPPFTYLAGAAGSGKTFAVKEWQQREAGLMLLATTGIAALNLGGTTVNAALGYFDTKSLQDSYIGGFLAARIGRLWRSGIRRLVLDEVSMLDGDQLTYIVKGIEEVNGRGYVLGKWTDDDDAPPPAMGLTLVGDFAQLRPVEGAFAWESPEWKRFEGENTLTLTEIRRQEDPAFIEMLRQARIGNGGAVLAYMRGKIHPTTDDTFQGPTLFATNKAVDKYNWIRLSRVAGADHYFESRRDGEQRSEWGNPKKEPYTWGVPIRLHTKIGALVMILANERVEGPPPQPFLYVNGDLGTVVEANDTTCYVELQRNGEVVDVTYVRREVLQPIDSARRRELRDKGLQAKISENGKFEITGWIEYMPIRTAYGSTVHKSQGLSLDAVQVNIRDHFFKTPGMLYVALSRSRTAAGLRLVGSEAALIERCAADPRLKPWL